MMTLAKIYSFIYIFIRQYFGWNIPGLGFLLRRVKQPSFINFLDQWMYFEPAAASSYGLHVVGAMQEPETHKFLNEAFDALNKQPAWFIEVGANIGAFLLDISRRPNVQLLGFEPSKACVNAIEKTMLRNHRYKCQVFPQLVGDITGLVSFDIGRHDGSASVMTSAHATFKVQQSVWTTAPLS